MVYVFLGMQGSGKGTQAKLLSNYLKLEHINLGEFFRKQISEKTPLGLHVNEFISKGNLVPDEFVCETVSKMFILKGNGFVFDGFPRTTIQAEYLNIVYPVKKVFYLELDDLVAKERMMARRVCFNCRADYNLLSHPPKNINECDKCKGMIVKRADDTETLIQNRLDLFHNETEPLTAFYDKLGLLAKINADNCIDTIHKNIVDIALESIK